MWSFIPFPENQFYPGFQVYYCKVTYSVWLWFSVFLPGLLPTCFLLFSCDLHIFSLHVLLSSAWSLAIWKEQLLNCSVFSIVLNLINFEISPFPFVMLRLEPRASMCSASGCHAQACFGKLLEKNGIHSLTF